MTHNHQLANALVACGFERYYPAMGSKHDPNVFDQQFVRDDFVRETLLINVPLKDVNGECNAVVEFCFDDDGNYVSHAAYYN